MVARNQKVLNRTAKIGYGLLYLRDLSSLSFDYNYSIDNVKYKYIQ